MSMYIVGLCYGSAVVVAVLLLWFFGTMRWIWHMLSLLTALAIRVYPLPASLSTPVGTIAVGCMFLFLLVWGVAAPFFVLRHQHPNRPHQSR